MSTRRKPPHFAPHEAIDRRRTDQADRLEGAIMRALRSGSVDLLKVSLAALIALDPDRAQHCVDLVAEIVGEPSEVWEVAR